MPELIQSSVLHHLQYLTGMSYKTLQKLSAGASTITYFH